MTTIAGTPKEYPMVPKRYAHIPPKALSTIGLLASLWFFHATPGTRLVISNFIKLLIAETSFPLFLLLTWVACAVIVKTALERIPHN